MQMCEKVRLRLDQLQGLGRTHPAARRAVPYLLKFNHKNDGGNEMDEDDGDKNHMQ
jgi:hypothetical protein